MNRTLINISEVCQKLKSFFTIFKLYIMKTNNLHSILKLALATVLFLAFGFIQEAAAQLTVINNTNCWVVVGEQEGNNCQFCNFPPGTWLAPVGFPGNTAVFNPSGCAIISPTQQAWIGIKYAVGNPFGPVGPSSFSDNTTYQGGLPCGYNQNNSQCTGGIINPQWFITAVNGATTVLIQ